VSPSRTPALHCLSAPSPLTFASLLHRIARAHESRSRPVRGERAFAVDPVWMLAGTRTRARRMDVAPLEPEIATAAWHGARAHRSRKTSGCCRLRWHEGLAIHHGKIGRRRSETLSHLRRRAGAMQLSLLVRQRRLPQRRAAWSDAAR